MTLRIRIYPDPSLRETCTEVTEFNDKLHATLDEMRTLMESEHGIGLAASQVGVLNRFFIADISKMVDEEYVREYGQPEQHELGLIEFINPVIENKEGDISWSEGCLSLPSIFYEVKRARTIVIRAQDRFGKPFTLTAKNILAVCCQHEYDHLEGKVFIDHVSFIKRNAAVSKLKKLKRQIQDR